jgi:hypothetical protein
LYDGITLRAGKLRAHVANHPETRRDVFELLGEVFAQELERTATGRAALGLRWVQDALAGQMRGQGRAMGACRSRFSARLAGGKCRRFTAHPFEFFQQQFQLPGHPFRATTEFPAAQLGNDKLQVFDLGLTSSQLILLFKHQRLERLDFIGQNRIHADTLHNQRQGEQPLPPKKQIMP